ncbi:977_t:CDS:2, partial [Ambispora leptoticha]
VSASACVYPGCLRKCYVDANGVKHPYCGKTCARAAASLASLVPKCARSDCNKPVSVDTQGITYSYCSKDCAKIGFKKVGPNCSRKGCTQKAYRDPMNGKMFHAFCSKECYWQDCARLVHTRLTVLTENDIDYQYIFKKFTGDMINASIKAIIRIQMPQSKIDRHLKLKAKNSATITLEMYHGTYSACDPMKIVAKKTPCCSNACGLCGIIREGNRSIYSKYNGSMWFADNPSVSLGYCRSTCGNTDAIFIIDVLANGPSSIYIAQEDDATLPRFLVLLGRKYF